jgi:hypothetical protein
MRIVGRCCWARSRRLRKSSSMIEATLWFTGTRTVDITTVGTNTVQKPHGARAYDFAER